MRELRTSLRTCTKVLLRLAWQQHKSDSADKSKRQAFWTIDEAKMVISAWKREKLVRFHAGSRSGGEIERLYREFLDIVERASQQPAGTGQSKVTLLPARAFHQLNRTLAHRNVLASRRCENTHFIYSSPLLPSAIT
jgi:hypothetical protein